MSPSAPLRRRRRVRRSPGGGGRWSGGGERGPGGGGEGGMKPPVVGAGGQGTGWRHYRDQEGDQTGKSTKKIVTKVFSGYRCCSIIWHSYDKL